jgi:hypothetical protein
VKITWGEKGVKGIKYLGEMPRDFRGCYTGMLYAYNERRPLLGVDVRDLPGLVDEEHGGDVKENFEMRRPDGTFVAIDGVTETAPPVKAKVAKPRAKPKPKPKPAPEPEEEAEEPQEEIAEVTDGR